MTEAPEKIVPLVPEGKHLLALTVAELDSASRRVKANIGEAVDNEKRWAAFAVLADIWARRAGDERREADFRKLDGNELTELLRVGADDKKPAGDQGDEDGDEANPTDSGPA